MTSPLRIVRYQVWLQTIPLDEPDRFVVLRHQTDLQDDHSFEVFATFSGYHEACYWASMLNRGVYTEERARVLISEGLK